MYKATLSSGMVVTFRKLDVRTQRLSIEAASHKAKDNHIMLSIYTQEEVLKNLLLTVNGKELSPGEKESIDTLFTVEEYSECMLVIDEVAGSAKKPIVEVISSTTGEK